MRMADILKWPWLWVWDAIIRVYEFILIPGASFSFDKGTTEGFTVSPVYDDTEKPYGTFPVSHFEAGDAPNDWPPKSNPLHDKVGSLLVDGGQWGPFERHYNFPKGSDFWQFDVVSPLVSKSKPWQQVQKVKAQVVDGYSTTGAHVSAALLLHIDQNGMWKVLPEIGGTVYQPVMWNVWTPLEADFNVPAGAVVRNVIVRVRGEWAKSSLDPGKYPLYEGAIAFDDIAAA